MVVSPTAPETTRRRRSRQPPAEPVWTDTLEALETLYVARPPSQSLEPETISSQWRVALDAAESALSAAVGAVPASELARRRARLVQERLETAKALTRLARVTSVLGEDHASVALRGRRSSSPGAGRQKECRTLASRRRLSPNALEAQPAGSARPPRRRSDRDGRSRSCSHPSAPDQALARTDLRLRALAGQDASRSPAPAPSKAKHCRGPIEPGATEAGTEDRITFERRIYSVDAAVTHVLSEADQDLHVVLEDGAAPHGRRVAERALLHSQRDRLSEEADGRRPRQSSCLRTRKDRRRRFLGPPAQRHG
jgi:hypothetical protein